ncbi:hypothetical protein CLOP_g5784 [Closterium sp. NIES-67]|nr:hypothetical protein CLOP_g5784 [Closterium sp. NIES-67]
MAWRRGGWLFWPSCAVLALVTTALVLLPLLATRNQDVDLLALLGAGQGTNGSTRDSAPGNVGAPGNGDAVGNGGAPGSREAPGNGGAAGFGEKAGKGVGNVGSGGAGRGGMVGLGREGTKGGGTVGKGREGAEQAGSGEEDGEEAQPVWAGDKTARQQVLSKPPSKWRTAVCLVGGARDFELTWPSILTRLLPSLPSPSLFLHSPLDENAFKLWGTLWTKKNQLAGVRVFASTWVNATEYGGGIVLHDQYSPQGDQGMLQYLRLVEGCVWLIRTYEERHSMRFDWVVRSRVDTYWSKPPPALASFGVDEYTVPWGTDCMGLNDRFGAGTWETAAPALHRLSMLRDMGTMGYSNLNSEGGFKVQLEVANVSVGRADLPFCVVSRRVYPDGMMPVAALTSTAPLNGAKCRPCTDPATGYEAIHRLHYYAPMAHIGPPASKRRAYGRGIHLCNERQPWEANWSAVFDQTVGPKLAEMRRAIMAVRENVRECSRNFAKMTRAAEAWHGPAPEAVCARMTLGPMVKVGGEGRSFPTALEPLSNSSGVLSIGAGTNDKAWESEMEEAVPGLTASNSRSACTRRMCLWTAAAFSPPTTAPTPALPTPLPEWFFCFGRGEGEGGVRRGCVGDGSRR